MLAHRGSSPDRTGHFDGLGRVQLYVSALGGEVFPVVDIISILGA